MVFVLPCIQNRNLISANSLSVNPTKWSNTHTIRQQIADELFEYVYGVSAIWEFRIRSK